MNIAEQIDITPLTKSYIFANTPSYLYRHFQRNDSLKQLVQQTTVDELIKEYKFRVAKDKKSVEDIVISYSILIAITFLEYQHALRVFDSFDLLQLDWGNDIKDIFTKNAKITNRILVKVNPPLFHADNMKTDSSTQIIKL